MKNKTVLLVDDEKHILFALKRLLRKEDFKLVLANSGEEGLKLIQEQEIHLVISDQRMPHMSGSDFLSKVKEISPNTVRVILSGYADVSVIVEAINLGQIYRFIGKPWDDDELKASIKQCLEHYDRFNTNKISDASIDDSVLQKNQELLETIQVQNKNFEMLNYDLEFMVKKLNSSLKFFKQMLNSLPMPVIGITTHYKILLSNVRAKELLPMLENLPSNSNIKDIMPTTVTDAISDCINNSIQNQKIGFSIDNYQLTAVLNAFEYENQIRGCVLTLEKESSKNACEIQVETFPEQSSEKVILIVDDYPSNLNCIARILRPLDCKIMTATSGPEALDILKSVNSCVGILSDLRMPGMDGIEFLKKSIGIVPNATRALLSGACEESLVEDCINNGIIAKFMEKPYNSKDLLSYFQNVLEKYSQE